MKSNNFFHLVISSILCVFNAEGTAVAQSKNQDPKTQTFRYVRLAKSKWITESDIRLQQSSQGLTYTSVTSRGKLKLTVTSKYDAKMRLRSAQVTTKQGKVVRLAAVRVTDAKATVTRRGKATITLPCPRQVIVTSAPDWTDSVLTVRRYKSDGKKTQTFVGLWIHPTKKPLSLTFRLVKLGRDSVSRGGKTERLDRFELVLRAGSKYLVWRNRQGNLVRLMSSRSRKGGIALAGWEKATRNLP